MYNEYVVCSQLQYNQLLTSLHRFFMHNKIHRSLKIRDTEEADRVISFDEVVNGPAPEIIDGV